MAYTLYSNGVLEKDGFYVPAGDDFPAYAEYLSWLALGNFPTLADGSVYIAKQEADKQAILQAKAEYQSMITRLEQIRNTANPPFTAAGFTQVVNAVKDVALYEERIMKILRRTLT